MNIKHTIRKFINKFGYDIRIIALRPSMHKMRTTIGESFSQISELGFQPKTVIELGAASGTMELYKVFANSYFLLIEPQKVFEPDLISILKQYKGSYILATAGSSSSHVTFNINQNQLRGSSLYKARSADEADWHEVTVPMIRIDDIIKDKELEGPYIIKASVQGAELDALEGAQQALLNTEVVALDVRFFEYMKGAPQFFDVISYMKNHGFVAYDIIFRWNRPLDNALGMIVIFFVKEKGIFRQNHSFSTTEQLKKLKLE